MSERALTSLPTPAAEPARPIELADALPRGRTLATYGDAGGEAHRVVLRGRLLVDQCRLRGSAVVVAELGHGEGVAEARAVLEAGYLDRARSEAEPLCRSLVPSDLSPSGEGRSRGEEPIDWHGLREAA